MKHASSPIGILAAIGRLIAQNNVARRKLKHRLLGEALADKPILARLRLQGRRDEVAVIRASVVRRRSGMDDAIYSASWPVR
ncbi:hypothetical protein JHU04_000505 [Brenneria sp. 4F2]|nr:hypothetical protein [Brenneria bubanii]